MMKDYIKNARLTGARTAIKTVAPKQYKDRKKQYFSTETRLFTEQYAKYSADYAEAEIQGLDPDRPFDYINAHVRLSDIVRSSSAISYEFDNYKVIDIAEPQYSYLRVGAKVKTMGSTWLVINPDNISNVLGKAIIQRCDAVWHYLDYYGNVKSEPMCFDRRLAKANSLDAQRATMVTKGYFDAKIQYNEATRQLDTNSRIILGTAAYTITGYSDFIREFTEDENSINLLEFDVRYEEPNHVIDDMVNKVAGGKTFQWDIKVSGEPTVKVDGSARLFTTSKRTAEEHTEIVTSTEEHPITYWWESSDDEVVSVDAFGTITGVSEGTATITCYLEQNPLISDKFEVTVAGNESDPHIAFTSNTQPVLRLYEQTAVTAQYYEGGEAVTGAEIVFTVDGADERAYSYEIENGKTIIIKCWAGSVKPLVVTASYGSVSESFEIALEGI